MALYTMPSLTQTWNPALSTSDYSGDCFILSYYFFTKIFRILYVISLRVHLESSSENDPPVTETDFYVKNQNITEMFLNRNNFSTWQWRGPFAMIKCEILRNMVNYHNSRCVR